MKKLIIVAVIIFSLVANAWADQLSLEDLIDSVNKTAEEFSMDFDKLTADLEAAVQSEALAREKYDKMLQSVDQVISKIGDDSVIWTNSDKLLEQFNQNKEYSEQKARESMDGKYWKESAEDWSEQANRLRQVRDDILTQRASVSNAYSLIMASKEIAIDLIKRDQAKRAISQMERVRDHLQKIDQNLKGIAERTKTINASDAPS